MAVLWHWLLFLSFLRSDFTQSLKSFRNVFLYLVFLREHKAFLRASVFLMLLCHGNTGQVSAANPAKGKARHCKCYYSWASNWAYSFPASSSLIRRVICHVSLLPPAVGTVRLNPVGVTTGAQGGMLGWTPSTRRGAEPRCNKRAVCRGSGQSSALRWLALNKCAEKKCSCAFLICTAGDFSSLMIYRALMLKR